jgi:hypothetical protein
MPTFIVILITHILTSAEGVIGVLGWIKIVMLTAYVLTVY